MSLRFFFVNIILILGFFSPVKANEKLRTLVFIGDSLTEGLGVAAESSYPGLIEKLIKEKKLPWKIINGGVSGATSASAVGRIKWFLKSKPDLIVLALGANDGLRGFAPAETKKNLLQALALAKENNLKIILAGMEMPPNYGKDYRDQFRKVFPELAKEMKVELIPFLLKDVGGKKDFNQADGMHPNEKGHQIIAKTVWESIKGHL